MPDSKTPKLLEGETEESITGPCVVFSEEGLAHCNLGKVTVLPDSPVTQR